MGPRRPPPLYVIAPMGAALSLLGASGAVAGSTSSCSSCVSPPPPPSCGCTTPTTHQVKVPGVSINTPQINIGLPSIGVGYASSSGVATSEASASSNVSVSTSTTNSSSTSNTSGAALLASSNGGGGGGFWSPEAGVSTEITDIKVETLHTSPPIPVQPICLVWKAVARQVAIQAACLDDKSVPHPASQTFPDRAVAPGYEGEVFRCIAGARMQYTLADFSGQADFNHGQTIVCNKGEALYHSAVGALQCRPQSVARDCNERSLLRRFGAGIKVVAVSGQRVCAQWGPQTVAVAPMPVQQGPMVLN